MQKVRTFMALAVALLLGGSALADEALTYGEGVKTEESVAISTLLATPGPYVGKTVRVEGRVIGVCAKRGCWIELASDEEFQSLIFKVDDGVITFPAGAKGKWAVAEGTFTKIELDLEQTRRYEAHQCQETGRDFDPTKVTEPKVLYRIQGSGALIGDRPTPPAGSNAS